MSRAGSQERTLLGLLGCVRPHWRQDSGLPLRIDALLRGDRRLGSRDRRLYRELLYTALRYLPWVEPLLTARPGEAARRIAWLATETPSVKPFRDEVAAGLPPCPIGAEEKAAVLGEVADALSPAWLRFECPEACRAPLLDTLLSRAPLWVRLQGAEQGSALEEFNRLGWPWRRSPLLPDAVMLPLDADVSKTQAYLDGRVEVQDVGSQRVLASIGTRPAGHWLDACAGAGGKTLQLASILGPQGRVTARDARPAPLLELRARATRAGLGPRIEVDGIDPAGGFDGALVDAPCSGSGTWRRSPHLRWTTTPDGISRAAALQLRLLLENAPRVRRGGTLVYSTCSLCRSENEAVVEAFLGRCTGVEVLAQATRLMADAHDGDGFFVASFRKT